MGFRMNGRSCKTMNEGKKTLAGDDSCHLSHNCPSKEAVSLAMVSHSQFYPQASMHSNNENFLAKFVRRICFGVQTQTNS